MQETAKKKVEGSEVGKTARENPTQAHITPTPECVNPTIGEERVITYIVGDMTNQECQNFVAHVSQCYHCFKEVVLWRAAQVSAEADNQIATSSSESARVVQPASSVVDQSTSIIEQHGRGSVRSRVSPPWLAFGRPRISFGPARWNLLRGHSEMRLRLM